MLNRYFYLVLLVFSLIITFYFTKSSIELYSAKNSLYTAESNLQKLKDEREKLKAEIEYRKTDEFVVNEARQNLNYSFDGEVTFIVPKDISINNTPNPTIKPNNDKFTDNELVDNTKKSKPNYINNLYLWYKAFF